MFKSWDIKNWEKADLNNDGLTDLVFIAFWGRYLSCAAIDEGNNSFKMINLSNNHSKQCDLVKPIKIGNDNYLKIHRIMSIPDLAHMQNMQYIDSVITDTLVYKFKHLIEFSKKIIGLITLNLLKWRHKAVRAPALSLALNFLKVVKLILMQKGLPLISVNLPEGFQRNFSKTSQTLPRILISKI
jgi:hypothetical protein